MCPGGPSRAIGLLALIVVAGCGDNITPSQALLKITAGSTLHTTESGGTATFTVGFDGQPDEPVTVTLATSNAAEGTVSPTSVLLTPSDFDGILITVTGVDDTEVDGDQPYLVRVDAARMGEAEVPLTNDDDDGEGNGGATVVASSTTTTEGGGMVTINIALSLEPTATVTMPITSSRPTEGIVSTDELVFTTADWNIPQVVTVIGQDDALDDGDQPYVVSLDPTTSTDPRFSGYNPPDVNLTNLDDDARGVFVSPISGPTSETGATATFTVVLMAEPTADVTITAVSSNPLEGTAAPAAITFQPQDWDLPRTITVTGVDDLVADGDIAYTIELGAAISADPGYAGIDPTDVAVTNLDNDGAGVTVTAPAGGLVTSESGGAAGTDSFTLVLRSKPTADVTIPILSSDLTEGLPTVSSVVFTDADWNVPQEVFVIGQDDSILDGSQAYAILLLPATSADPVYNNFDAIDVAATNLDNELAPGITVTPTSGLVVSELGDIDTFRIVLDAPPTASVTISLTSSDTTEGTLSTGSVTFTTLDWDTPRTIAVIGRNDPFADGNVDFTILTGPAVTADPLYAGIDAADVSVTNFDNETAQVFVRARQLQLTSENGGPSGSTTFSMRLTRNPTSAVTCTLQSSDPSEGTAAPQTLVFTPGNFNFRTVTVTGVDDPIADGNVAYQIQTNACTSADARYNAQDPRDVNLINLDNE